MDIKEKFDKLIKLLEDKKKTHQVAILKKGNPGYKNYLHFVVFEIRQDLPYSQIQSLCAYKRLVGRKDLSS